MQTVALMLWAAVAGGWVTYLLLERAGAIGRPDTALETWVHDHVANDRKTRRFAGCRTVSECTVKLEAGDAYRLTIRATPPENTKESAFDA